MLRGEEYPYATCDSERADSHAIHHQADIVACPLQLTGKVLYYGPHSLLTFLVLSYCHTNTSA